MVCPNTIETTTEVIRTGATVAEPEAVLQEAADLRAQAAATPNATAEVGAGAIPQATVEALV